MTSIRCLLNIFHSLSIKYLPTEGRGSSKMVTWWRCECCYRQILKDVCKILHHFVPLSRENFLKKQVNRILFSTVFIFSHHQGFLGCARVIFLKRDMLKTQHSILRPHRGHALKMIKSSLLWYHWSRLFSAWNESGDITHKYLEILQERQKYNRDIAEIKQESPIYSNTRFLLTK